MHELSIATSLYEQVKRHTPPGATVTSIRLRIGPMQGIEPDSLRFGWEAVCQEENANVPELMLEMLPWHSSARSARADGRARNSMSPASADAPPRR